MLKKRMLIILILPVISILMLIGCTEVINNDTGVNETGDDNPDVVQENREDKIMAEFDALMGEEPKPDSIIEFIDKNISDVSGESASKMLEELERAQKIYLLELEEKYYSGESVQKGLMDIYEEAFDISSIYYTKDEELRSLLTETRNMGYKVETTEGTFFPVINYEYAKKFGSYASEYMKSYIDIMAVESNKASAKDAALMIGWDEIVKRALAQEEYIKKYSNSDKAESIEDLQKRYIIFMLFGLDNTPLFSYDTKKMYPKAKEAYEEAVISEVDSPLLQLLSEYMEILEKSNYKLTDEADRFRKAAVEY